MAEQWGFMGVQDSHDPVNAIEFVVRQIISRGVCTGMIVKILSVDTAAKTLDAQPMVDQVTPTGQSIPHGPIHEIPYGYEQGGNCQIKLDPVVGDIGVIVFAHRDITRVKRTWKNATPQTLRAHNIADAMYVRTLVSATTPQHTITFDQQNGIAISSPLVVKIEADAQITGNLSVGGSVTADGDVKAGSISLESHTHSGVQAGSSNTGKPQ